MASPPKQITLSLRDLAVIAGMIVGVTTGLHGVFSAYVVPTIVRYVEKGRKEELDTRDIRLEKALDKLATKEGQELQSRRLDRIESRVHEIEQKVK